MLSTRCPSSATESPKPSSKSICKGKVRAFAYAKRAMAPLPECTPSGSYGAGAPGGSEERPSSRPAVARAITQNVQEIYHPKCPHDRTRDAVWEKSRHRREARSMYPDQHLVRAQTPLRPGDTFFDGGIGFPRTPLRSNVLSVFWQTSG